MATTATRKVHPMDVTQAIPHLVELRTRTIRSVIVVLLFFLALFYIDEYLYTEIAKPLLTQLPAGSSLIATEVTSTFMAPMKLAWILALFLAIPYLFYQLWSFVTPGLYANEKRAFLPFLIASTFLFYLGIAFGYFIICPMALGFFAKCAPAGVSMMTDIGAYLNFVLGILFASGIAFQVPVITLALIKANWVTMAQLIYLRPYIIVAAFVLGMILTPPDVLSQILLALPMWGLFEIGLIFAKYLKAQSS
jgi:sec-independent protein translocase protein TatC